jgi:hypothetical protein
MLDRRTARTIVAGALICVAAGCSADAAGPAPREVWQTAARIADNAVARVMMPLPAEDLTSLGSFLALPGGRIVVAQSEPGRIFAGVIEGDAVKWVREVGQAKTVTDLAWHAPRGLLVLDSLASEFRLISLDGRTTGGFKASRFERSVCFAPDGTSVSTSFSSSGSGGLLLHLDASGRVLREFGRRIKYENRDLDFALNSGRLACAGDVVYLAFVHPGIVRAYSIRRGELLWEHALTLERTPIEPSIERTTFPGGGTTLKSSYSLASLDIAADGANVYVLKSGQELRPAIAQGSDRIEVIGRDGSRRADLIVPFRAHRLQVADNGLYLLNRSPAALRRIGLSALGIPGL